MLLFGAVTAAPLGLGDGGAPDSYSSFHAAPALIGHVHTKQRFQRLQQRRRGGDQTGVGIPLAVVADFGVDDQAPIAAVIGHGGDHVMAGVNAVLRLRAKPGAGRVLGAHACLA
ncbi:hypothetical protein WJ976_12910 [Achromobacter denitrificans]